MHYARTLGCSGMANLALSAFLALASQCAPSIAPDTLAAVAKAEVSFNEIAIDLSGVGGGTRYSSIRAEYA